MEDSIHGIHHKWGTYTWTILNRITSFMLFVKFSIGFPMVIYQMINSDEKMTLTMAIFLLMIPGIFFEIVNTLYGKQWMKLINELDEVLWPTYAAGKLAQCDLLGITKEYKVMNIIPFLTVFTAYWVFLFQNGFMQFYIFLLQLYIPYWTLQIISYIYYIAIFFGCIHLQIGLHMFLYFYYHLRTQLLLVNHLLQNIDHGLETLSDELYQQQITYRLKKCIKHHQEIFCIFVSVRYVLNNGLFFLLYVAVAVAVGAFLVYLESSAGLATLIIYLTCVITNGTAFIHNTQCLVDESLNISVAVTSTQWYNWNYKNKMLLLNLLVKGQQPMIIYVGNTFATYQAFIQIAKAIYSVCCLLRTVNF